MTGDEKRICTVLGGITYLPGSWDKRMANSLYNMASSEKWIEKGLTEKQNEWMYRLLYKYRKQLPNTYEDYKGHPFCQRKLK